MNAEWTRSDAALNREGSLIMRLTKLGTKQVCVAGAIVPGSLIAEFFILEGTIGISFPSDRYSAVSRAEIKVRGLEEHRITWNTRFTVVDLLTAHGTRSEPLVLRETFFADRQTGTEGSPQATGTVEAMKRESVRWTFREPGERGDAITDDLYRVIKFGCCDSPRAYTYFSLVDGRKVRTQSDVELSRGELEALDLSIAK